MVLSLHVVYLPIIAEVDEINLRKYIEEQEELEKLEEQDAVIDDFSISIQFSARENWIDSIMLVNSNQHDNPHDRYGNHRIAAGISRSATQERRPR